MRIREYGLAALAGIAVLACFSFLFDPSRIRFAGLNNYLNDQLEYISVARNVAEHGTFDSAIIYPSTLHRGPYRHVPGYATLLALSAEILGDRPLGYIFPSLVAFVIAVLSSYSIAKKIYDRQTAQLCAFAVLACAPLIAFSYTAMADAVFVASTLVGFWLIQRFPRYWLVPLFLLIPFVVRETGALLVFPAVGLLLAVSGDRRNAAVAFLLSVAVLTPVYWLLNSPGSSTIFLANFFGLPERVKYFDAFFEYPPMNLGTIAQAVIKNVAYQAEFMFAIAGRMFSSLEAFGLFSSFLLGIFCLVGGWRRKNLFALSIGIMAAALWLLLVCFYQLSSYVGLRMVMFALPFIFIGALGLIRGMQPRMRWLIVIVLAALQMKMLFPVSRAFAANDALEDQCVRWVEELGHDNSTVLVSNECSFTYAYKHKVKVSLLASNIETLKLLDKMHPAGTLIYRPGQLSGELNVENIKGLGFTRVRESDSPLGKMVVFQKEQAR